LPEPSVVAVAIDYLRENFPYKVDWQTYLSTASTASAWQTQDHRPPVRITADNAKTLVSDLSLPAVVVVENGRNDGGFLKAVLRAYDPAMRVAIKEGWLHFVHSGGGGEQANLADEAASRFNHVCRVLIVKDNDSRFPYPRRSPELVEREVPEKPIVHVWSRLEVENYLPDAVLARSDHPQAEDLLRCLRQMRMDRHEEGAGEDASRIRRHIGAGGRGGLADGVPQAAAESSGSCGTGADRRGFPAAGRRSA
jgi:hypothetical protein